MSGTLASIKELRAKLREELEGISAFREYEYLGKVIADLEKMSKPEGGGVLASTRGLGNSAVRKLTFEERQAREEALNGKWVVVSRMPQPSNTDLCVERVKEVGLPQTTGELTAFLEGKGRQPKSLVSSLSRDNRLVNYVWGGNKAWWLNGAALPPEPDGLPGLGGTTEGESSAAGEVNMD